LLAACAELGVISDGTSISMGKPSNGYLLDAKRLPDKGEGFTTREVWLQRNNRFATDELLDLVTGVARRMAMQIKGVNIVVADLSARTGGGVGSSAFHRSHQNGRDADLLYYMRDSAGAPFEPDAMHVFDGKGNTKDGTGITIDVPRTWLLVKELVVAPEAPVQFIFIYEPIAQLLLDHAKKIGEPEALIARARKTLRQPGDSARHDDHMHVRVYCSRADRAYGCVDIGPMELLAEHEADRSQLLDKIGAVVMRESARVAAAQVPAASVPDPARPVQPIARMAPAAGAGAASADTLAPAVMHSLLVTRPDRIDLRGWR
jgi:penicillin-insensitive murein DD-endopeptidase